MLSNIVTNEPIWCHQALRIDYYSHLEVELEVDIDIKVSSYKNSMMCNFAIYD